MDSETDGKAPPGLVALGLKGGPGKSTTAAAMALKAKAVFKGRKVALFDADIFSPNLPELLGYDGKAVDIKDNTYIPVVHHDLRLISRALYHLGPLGFTQSSDMVSLFIREVATHTAWNDSPVVIIDLPAGSGVELKTVVDCFDIVGGVVTTLPNTASDCEAILDLMYHVGIARLGIVENMSSLKCKCGKVHCPFGKGVIKKLAKKLGIPYLGSLPLSPKIPEGLKKGKLTPHWKILDGLMENLFGKSKTPSKTGTVDAPSKKPKAGPRILTAPDTEEEKE